MLDVRKNNRKKQKTPLIVELVGLAGAGKTTLSRLMSQQMRRILIGPELELRKINHIPIFAAQAPSLLPVLLQSCPTSRRFTWDEIKAMAYLNGWPRVLDLQVTNQNVIIILDHGPIFKLATLNAFGPERLKKQGAEKWWNKMFEQWAHTLDMIVWLDAPDSVLRDRINNRNQKHIVKGKSGQETERFLDIYRKSYEQILATLNSYGGPTFYQFDTSCNPIEIVVDEILYTLTFNN